MRQARCWSAFCCLMSCSNVPILPHGGTPTQVSFSVTAQLPRVIHCAGKQHFLDASVAYKRAVLNCVDYLSKFGYTKEQVKHLCVLQPRPTAKAVQAQAAALTCCRLDRARS